MARALVLGVGNILMQDEGVGVRVLEWLQTHCLFPAASVRQDSLLAGNIGQNNMLSDIAGQDNNWSGSAEVTLIDGGTMGLELLHYLPGVDHLLILDAIQANQTPGAIITLTGQEVPAFLGMKISPHQIGVQELLATAQLMGYTPPEVIILGAEPDWLSVGLEMSPVVTAQVEALARLAIDQLKQWGYQARFC